MDTAKTHDVIPPPPDDKTKPGGSYPAIGGDLPAKQQDDPPTGSDQGKSPQSYPAMGGNK
jgi:hypothetical protein